MTSGWTPSGITSPSNEPGLGGTVATTNTGSTAPYLTVTSTPNSPPTITGMYPPTNYSSPSLTSELTATATDPDGPNALTYQFQIFDAGTGSTTPVVSSPTLSTPDWTVPAGGLTWGRTYFWIVNTYDGVAYAPLTYNFFSTAVPQPLVTSGLSANDGHGFSPAIANYTTQMVDAQVPTVGPKLAMERDYNSRDPRVSEAFGAGWSSVLDTRVQTIGSLAIITYRTVRRSGGGRTRTAATRPRPAGTRP